MRSETKTHEDDRSAGSVAGAKAPVVMVRRGQPCILVYRGAEPPPRIGSEGATSLDCWEGVGEVAVNLVSEWSLPRMLLALPGER